MKFRKTTTCVATLRKQEFYNFDITEEQRKEAKTRDHSNPLLIYEHGTILALYYEKGELRISYFLSYYGFAEGFGEHKIREFDNMVICTCGKKFPQGKKKLGKQNFEKHLREIEKLKEEDNKK